jgi:BASS family bile acid:Na+ symporter
LLSILVFFAVVLLTAKLKNPAMKQIGITGVAAIIFLTLGSWVAGWLLGGPGVADRKVVAISASMRNVGVCMVLANHYFPNTSVAIPLLAFSGVTIPMNMIFALATGRVKDKSAGVAKNSIGAEHPSPAEVLHQQ